MGNENKNSDVKRIYPFEECELYVELLQRNIDRMANNSANCKNWLVAIVTGALAISFSQDAVACDMHILIITLMIAVTLLFYFMDCYYLGLERRFKNAEKLFVAECKKDDNETNIKLLLMSFKDHIPTEKELQKEQEQKPDSNEDMGLRIKKQLKDTYKGMKSISTTTFYLFVLIMLLVLLIVIY
jgi:hypothetical protein